MTYDTAQKFSLRDAFGEAVIEAGKNNPDVVVLSADLSESTRVSKFEELFPERFIQIGVAEQNMTGIAAGLSYSGKIPVMTSFSVFSPGGNWAQIRLSIAYSNANVKIVSTHAGFSAGEDGATHQALEDIALMRVLPNMTVLSPVDAIETKKAVEQMIRHKGPVYLRLFREPTPVITKNSDEFTIGKSQLIKEGSNLTVIGCGPVLVNAVEALEKYSCDIINCSSVKPLDENTILKSVKKTGKVVTIEEHQISGGLGSAVSELISSKYPSPVLRLGANDVYGESGKYEQLLDKNGLSIKKINQRVKEFLGE